MLDVAEVNAFALPGGHIFLQRGLLDAVATEMELAGVLAQLFATHPPSEERIQAFSARWWAERPPGGLIVDSPDFQRMKAHLATLPPAQRKDPPQPPKR